MIARRAAGTLKLFVESAGGEHILGDEPIHLRAWPGSIYFPIMVEPVEDGLVVHLDTWHYELWQGDTLLESGTGA